MRLLHYLPQDWGRPHRTVPASHWTKQLWCDPPHSMDVGVRWVKAKPGTGHGMGECWPLMSGLVSTQHPALPTPAVWQVIFERNWVGTVSPSWVPSHQEPYRSHTARDWGEENDPGVISESSLAQGQRRCTLTAAFPGIKEIFWHLSALSHFPSQLG